MTFERERCCISRQPGQVRRPSIVRAGSVDAGIPSAFVFNGIGVGIVDNDISVVRSCHSQW